MAVELERTRRLIELARAGRGEAYDELFRTHQPELERRLARRLPADLLRRVEPADVIQEALVDAVRGFDSFRYRGESSFRKWLARLLENRMHTLRVHYVATQKRDSCLDVPLARSDSGSSGPRGAMLADTGTSPSSAAAAHEDRERIERALATLPPDRREVIRRIELEGRSVSDVALEMGRSENAVRKLLTRALLELAGALSGVEGPAKSIERAGPERPRKR